MKRRDVLQLSTLVATGLAFPLTSSCTSADAGAPPGASGPPPADAPFALPALPYAKEALAPYISAETLDYHHDKHHRAYVANLNQSVSGKPEAAKSLETSSAPARARSSTTPPRIGTTPSIGVP